MIKNIATLIFVIGIIHFTCAQTADEAIQATIKARVDNGINTGIVVGIMDASGTRYYSYGVKSAKGNEAVNEHAVFEIGSISKTFTATLLAEAVDKGEVKLTDPIQRYLPSGVTAPVRNGASIQLVHLSNHTSSLPRLPSNLTPANPVNPYADYTEKQLYDFLGQYTLTRDIGSEYEYSNYAAGLLGHILATRKGSTYEKQLAEVITQPLKMNNTGTTLTPKMKANLAMGHHEGAEVSNWDFDALAGAGAIRSTAMDMVIYLRANMGKTKSKLYAAMQLAHQNSRPAGSNPMVGLGWHKTTADGIEIVWHNGGTGGYRSFTGFIKGGDKGVVVLTNSTASVDDIGMYVLNPKSPLKEIKNSIARKLRSILDAQGTENAVKTYWELKKTEAGNYDWSEEQLRKLGADYLGKGETDKAIAVLGLNAEVYPQSSSAFYDLGEALLKKGDKENAIGHYKKSLALHPGNQLSEARLKELGITNTGSDIEIAIEILEKYTGQYQLAPGFILTISREDKQLKAQATGQPQFPIFPKSQNVFYLKVVEAQLTFNQDSDGKVQSLTLLQGGKEIPGRKL